MTGTQSCGGGAPKSEPRFRKEQTSDASEKERNVRNRVPGRLDSKSSAEVSPRPQPTTPASSVPPPKAQTSRGSPTGTLFEGLPCGHPVEAMSVRQLREALKERGLSPHGLLEKREFQDLLRAHLPPTPPQRAEVTPATASDSSGAAQQMPAAAESAAHAGASTPLSSKTSETLVGPSEELKEGRGEAGSGSLEGTPLPGGAPKSSATPSSAAGSTATPTDSSDPLPKTPSATPLGECNPPPFAFQESRANKAPESAPGNKIGAGEELKTVARPRRTGRRVRFTPMAGRPQAPAFEVKTEQENAGDLEVSDEKPVMEGLRGSGRCKDWASPHESRVKATRARGKGAEAGIRSERGLEMTEKRDGGRKAVPEKEDGGLRRSSLGSNSESVKARGGAGAARVKQTARRERGGEEDSDSSSDDDSESDSGSGSGSESGEDSSSSDESESEVETEAKTLGGTGGAAIEKKENGSSTGKGSPVCAAKQKVETEFEGSPVRGPEHGGSHERRKPGRPKRAASQARSEQPGAQEPAVTRGRPVGRPGASTGPQKAPGSRKPRAVGLKPRVKRFWTSVRARAHAQEQNASILRRSRKLWRLKTAPADQAAEARKRRIEARKAKVGEDDKAFALASRQKRLEALQTKALARRAAAKVRAEKAAAQRAAAAQESASAKEPTAPEEVKSAPELEKITGMQKRRRPSVSILEAAVKRQAARNGFLELGKNKPVGEAPRECDDGPACADVGSRFRVPGPKVPPNADEEIAPGVSERVAKAKVSAGMCGVPGGSPGSVRLSPLRSKSVPRRKRTAGRQGVKGQTTVKPPEKMTPADPKLAREGLSRGGAAEQRTDGFVEDDSGEEAEGAAAQAQADAVGIAGLSPEKEPPKAPVKPRVTGKRATRKRPVEKKDGKENVVPPGVAMEKRKEQAAALPERGARKAKGNVYVNDDEVRAQKRAVLKGAKVRQFAPKTAPLRRTTRPRNKAPSAAPKVKEPRLRPDARTDPGGKETPPEADVRTDDLPLANGRKTRGGGLKAALRAVDARGKAANAEKEGVKAGKVGLRKRAGRGDDAAADVSVAAGEIDGEPKVGKKRKSTEAPAADGKETASRLSGRRRRVSEGVGAGQAARSGAKDKPARREVRSREQSLEAESDEEIVVEKQRKEKHEKRVKKRAAESEEEDEERARKRRRKEKRRASREEETDEEVPGRKHRGKHKRRHKHEKKHRDEGESNSERRRRKHKRKRRESSEEEEERKQRRAERRERKRARREARRADKPEYESEGRPDLGDASGDRAQESDSEREQRRAETRERKRAEREAAAAHSSYPGHEETLPDRTAEASEEKDGQAGSGTGDRTSVGSDKTPGKTPEGEAAEEAARQETTAREETGELTRPEGAFEKDVNGTPESPQVVTPSERVVQEAETGTEPEPVITQVELTNRAPALGTGYCAESGNAQPGPNVSGASTAGNAQSLPRDTIGSTPTEKEKVPPPEPGVAPRGGELGEKAEPATEEGAALVARGVLEKDSGEASASPETVGFAEPTFEKADAGEGKESGSDLVEESEEKEWKSAALDALLKFESGRLDVNAEATPQSKLKRSDIGNAEESLGVPGGPDGVAPQGPDKAPVAKAELEAQTNAPAGPTRGSRGANSVDSLPESPPRAIPPVANVESILDWVAAKGRCNLADISGNFAGTAPAVLEGLLQDLLGSFDIGVDAGHYFVL